MRRLGAVVEGVGAAIRPVDELVADHELAQAQVGSERSGGIRPELPAGTHLAERPDVRAVGDLVWRQLVPAPVAGEERDPDTVHLRESEWR